MARLRDLRGRIVALVTSRAAGAVVAQVWQAGGSLVLQVLAAWAMGAAGLGVFSLLYGVIIFVTALGSGMVGDSLVILDRQDGRIRAGLQFWALVLAGAGLVVSTVATGATGLLGWGEALWFGLALALFMIEELIRRLLMATMRFWRLVLVDGSALLAALTTLGVLSLTGSLSISTFLVALCVGQTTGLLVGVAMLPAEERTFVPLRRAGIREVAGFGMWRGAQVSIPPLVLTLSRTLLTVAISAAALGQVEAARILVAPAILAVQGFGSYLLSGYVRDREFGVIRLRRRAWRASAAMMAGAAGLGLVMVVLTPVIGPFVSGPDFAIEQVTVLGWVCYVIGTASLQPFASLGAVLGQQSRLLACRVVDAGLALAALWLLIAVLGQPAWLTPYVLGLGLAAGGFIIRLFVLSPLTDPTRTAGPRGSRLVRSSNASQ